MADVKPLKLVAAGGGLGELREFGSEDRIPGAHLPANNEALSALEGAADRLPYFTGAGALSLAVLTTAARTFLAATSQPEQRSALALGDVAVLTKQTAPLDSTANRVLAMASSGVGPYGIGANAISYNDANEVTYSGFGRNPALNAANAPTAGITCIIGMPHISGMTSLGGQLGLNYTTDGGNYLAVPRLFARSKSSASSFAPWIEFLSTGNAAAFPLTAEFAPSADNARSNGSASRRWSVVYAGTGTINTSDAREKTAVRALTAAEMACAQALAAEIGAYQFLAAVAEKGAEAARQHIGMTVQRAIEVLEEHGLDPFAYGFICYDAWEEQVQEHPATYQQIEVLDPETDEVVGYEQGELIREAWSEVTLPAGDRYSFRMDELLAFVARGQAARLDAMEARLTALENG